jgi:hypothetical protein
MGNGQWFVVGRNPIALPDFTLICRVQVIYIYIYIYIYNAISLENKLMRFETKPYFCPRISGNDGNCFLSFTKKNPSGIYIVLK